MLRRHRRLKRKLPATLPGLPDDAAEGVAGVVDRRDLNLRLPMLGAPAALLTDDHGLVMAELVHQTSQALDAGVALSAPLLLTPGEEVEHLHRHAVLLIACARVEPTQVIRPTLQPTLTRFTAVGFFRSW